VVHARQRIAIFAIGALPVWLLASLPFLQNGWPLINLIPQQLGMVFGGGLTIILGLLAGFVTVGLVFLLRKWPEIAIGLLALVALFVYLTPLSGMYFNGLTGFVSFLVGASLTAGWLFPRRWKPLTTFGSAEWADEAHILEHGHFEGEGFWLGHYPVPAKRRRDPPTERLLRYNGDRHLLTVAPTRSGKGVSAIVPNLLTYKGSVLCIDPKGENAMITLLARHKMGQHVFVVDPWETATPAFQGVKPARFNPLDWLVADDPDMAENAMLIADSLVMSSAGEGEGKNRFYDEEAKALLAGVIALGRLQMVETAYGLMAGFGMQLWGIVQDLSQLERIYGKGWQTFISNSGVVQYFGSRDEKTAGYFSKLAGVTTIVTLSGSISRAVTSAIGGGSSTSTTTESRQDQQRNLAYPDELMRLPRNKQLVLIENLNPISARKIVWHKHELLKTLGRNLRPQGS